MKTIEQIQTQINDLQKELESLKNKPSYKRWKAEEREKFFFINYGDVDDFEDLNDEIDNGLYKMWNYYKTEEEAEKARDKQLAIMRVNDRIDELNEGWEHNNRWERCYIIYHFWYEVCCISAGWLIKPMILNYCKTEEIAKQIISGMKDDLDLIFNIK